MPIWFELLVMLVVTYAAGLAIGWALWKQADEPAEDDGELDT